MQLILPFPEDACWYCWPLLPPSNLLSVLICPSLPQDLVFYQLPQHAHFYLELVNMLARRDDMMQHATVKAIITRTDALRLEPIVGTARSQKMLKGSKSTFLFC